MARTLKAHVAVTDGKHGTVWFRPGDDVPSWAARQITNPDAWDGDATDDAGDDDGSAYPDGEPAKTWTVKQLKAYAADNGVDLGDATRKDDVFAAITGGQGADSGAGEDGDGSGDTA